LTLSAWILCSSPAPVPLQDNIGSEIISAPESSAIDIEATQHDVLDAKVG